MVDTTIVRKDNIVLIPGSEEVMFFRDGGSQLLQIGRHQRNNETGKFEKQTWSNSLTKSSGWQQLAVDLDRHAEALASRLHLVTEVRQHQTQSVFTTEGGHILFSEKGVGRYPLAFVGYPQDIYAFLMERPKITIRCIVTYEDPDSANASDAVGRRREPQWTGNNPLYRPPYLNIFFSVKPTSLARTKKRELQVRSPAQALFRNVALAAGGLNPGGTLHAAADLGVNVAGAGDAGAHRSFRNPLSSKKSALKTTRGEKLLLLVGPALGGDAVDTGESEFTFDRLAMLFMNHYRRARQNR